MALEHEHVATPCRDHAGCRYPPRKAQPVRREVQRRDDPPEDVERSAAAAVPPRAATGTAADHPARAAGHDATEAGGIGLTVFKWVISFEAESDRKCLCRKDFLLI